MKIVCLTAFLLFAVACTKKNPDLGSTPADPLLERGRAVYQTNCTVCHNSDPHIAGSVGPAIVGSSQALLEARIMKASYPEGYKPKVSSKVMVAIPGLEKDIPALFRYLNSN